MPLLPHNHPLPDDHPLMQGTLILTRWSPPRPPKPPVREPDPLDRLADDGGPVPPAPAEEAA